VIYISVPTAATRAIVPLATGIFTAILAQFGAETVAAFGVSQKIEFLALTLTTSLAIVYGPYAGQNLGAGKVDRVWRGLTLGYRFSMLSGIVLWGGLTLTAPLLGRIFTDNPAVIREIAWYLRIVPAGYGLYGVFLIAVSVMYVLHRPLEAAGLSLIQMFVLSVPLALAGARFFGAPGVFGAIGVSYMASGFLARRMLTRMLIQFEGR
jgi:Na+-driven multidrug efflux pump